MRTVLKNQQFRIFNIIFHPIGKTGRGYHIVPTKSNLSRRFYLTQLRFAVVGYNSIRLSNKCVQRLCWSSSYKIRQCIYVIRPSSIEFRSKAPWENALDNHLWNTSYGSCHHLPAFYNGFKKKIGLCPPTMERQWLNLIRVFSPKPHTYSCAQ